VRENHRCESWPTTIIIKQEIIDAIRAEALRGAADRAMVWYDENHDVNLSDAWECQHRDSLYSAITQEADHV
jgi:hypothetical protein